MAAGGRGGTEGSWRQSDPGCCRVLNSEGRASFEPAAVGLAGILLAAIAREGPALRALSTGQPASPGLVGLVFPAGGRVGEELAGAEGFM